MLELKIVKSELEDLVRKMALPTGNGKDEFVFGDIAPKITPDGGLEWIGKTKNITAWVRARELTVSGVAAPIRVPLRVSDILGALAFFQKDDIIQITHDTERGEDILTTPENAIRKRTTKLPSIVESEVKGMQEAFPGKLDTDGVILLKQGTKRPELHAACDASVFQDLVANTRIVMGSKRKEEIPDKYYIAFDGVNQRLKTVAGIENDRAHASVEDEVYSDSITGTGELYYSMGFADVMSVLSGEIHIYATEKGPLWVSQHGTKVSVRYLLPPANVNKD